MNTVICDAIRDKYLLQFNYHEKLRIVEPYCYGVSTAGHEVLRAFQTEGGTHSSFLPSWRMFLVEEIEDLQKLPDQFPGFAPGYNPNGDDSMSTIFCQV